MTEGWRLKIARERRKNDETEGDIRGHFKWITGFMHGLVG
jgi:hypothetical protein